MQITQIQGPSVGQTQVIPQGQERVLPNPAGLNPQAQAAPQGYIQNQAGQPMLVPHANVPVAVNGQLVQTPTLVNHGDTVTINHGNPNQTVLALHKPDEKLTSAHIGDAVKKAGLNFNESQIQALVEEIELVEHHKFILLLGTAAGVVGFLLVCIIFLVFFVMGKASNNDLSSLKGNLQQVQQKVGEVEDAQSELADSLSADEVNALKEKISELETKLAESQATVTTLDENTKAELQKVVTEMKTYSQSLQDVQGITDKIKQFESVLQSSELGKIGETMQYYQELQTQCGTNECCLNSVSTMMKNSYVLADQGKCPAGQEVNRLQCLDSFVWCVNPNLVPNNQQSLSDEEVQKAVQGVLQQLTNQQQNNGQ